MRLCEIVLSTLLIGTSVVGKFICSVCKAPFIHKAALTSHVNIVHEKNSELCHHCRRFIQVSKMASHIIKCNPNGIERPPPVAGAINDDCHISGAETSDIASSQISEVNEDEDYDTSDVPDEDTPVVPPQVQHKVTPPRPVKRSSMRIVTESEDSSGGSSECIDYDAMRCIQCRKNFTNNTELQQHITHSHVKNLSFINFAKMRCSICKTACSDTAQLNRHIIETHKLNPTTGRDITNGDDHGIEQTNFCDFCKKRFSNRGNLRHHMKLIHGMHSQTSAAFSCTTCSAPFILENSLRSHLREIHHMMSVAPPETSVLIYDPSCDANPTDSPNWCKWCQKSYSRKENFVEHNINVHGSFDRSEAVHTCQICDAIFVVEKSLTRHQKELHSIKPHVIENPETYCKMCEKSFNKPRALMSHNTNMHGDFDAEKAPFSCDMCSAIFIRDMSLVDHKSDVHGKTDDRYFECCLCKRQFNNVRHVYYHVVRSHQIDLKDVHGQYRVIKEEDVRVGSEKMDTSSVGGENIIEQDKLNPKNWCDMCQKGFSMARSLEDHITNIHGSLDPVKAPFSCDLCSAIFTKEHSLLPHVMELHHPDGDAVTIDPYCTMCQTAFQCRGSLRGHIKNVHGGFNPKIAPFACDLCPAIFVKEYLLIPHAIKLHNPDVDTTKDTTLDLYCSMCQTTFNNRSALHTHIKKIHGVFNPKKAAFSCDMCPAMFVRDISLVHHKRELHGITDDRYFECNICKRQCNNIITIHHHVIRNHKIDPDAVHEEFRVIKENEIITAKSSGGPLALTNGGPLAITNGQEMNSSQAKLKPANWCDMCQKDFTSALSLINHTITIHGSLDPEQAPFACQLCPAIFVKELVLTRHAIDLHNPDGNSKISIEPYCSMCQVNFPSPGALNSHTKNMHGSFNPELAPFSCDLCPAIFVRDMSLSEHKNKLHGITDDRYFECRVCKKQYNNVRRMYYHVGRSCLSDEFKNKHAQYRVISKDEVKIAMNDGDSAGSDDQAKLWCQMCQKSFSQRGNLRKHNATVHGSEDPSKAIFTCKLCAARFVSSSRLTHHKITVHDVEELGPSLAIKMSPSCHDDIGDKSDSTSRTWCDMCKKLFASIGSHRKHMDAVHGYGDSSIATYICESCPASFVSSATLAKHRSDLHDLIEVGLYECEVCNKQSDALHKIQFHLVTVHSIEKSEITNNYRLLKSPELKTSSDKTNQELKDSPPSQAAEPWCHMCKKLYSSVGNLRQHMDHVHGSNDPSTAIYICEFCPAVFVSPITLAKHRSNLHDLMEVGMYECVVCNKQFDALHKIYHHVSIVHSMERLQISDNCRMLKSPEYVECPKSKKDDNLDDSKPISSPRGTIVNICPVCDKDELSSRALSNHIRVHHSSYDVELKQFRCAICFNMSETESGWIAHLDSIHFDIPFEDSIHCRACKKHVSRVSFVGHIKNHRSEKIYPANKCYVCHETRKSQKSLDRHMRDCHHVPFVHMGVNDAQESSSGTGSDDEAEFAVPNESPHIQCPICFITMFRRNMPRHLRGVHKCSQPETAKLLSPFKRKAPNVFICSLCNVDQPSYRMLKRHLLIMHKGQRDLEIVPITEPSIINDAKIISELCNDDSQGDPGNDDPNARRPITSQVLSNENFDISDRPRRALDGRYWCSSCTKSFASSPNHMQHVACYHLGFRFYCIECDMSYSCRTSFERHTCYKVYRELRAFAHRKFTISLTEKASTASLSPPPKKRRIQKVQSFACYKCDTAFPDKDAVNHHLRNIHLVNPKTGAEITKSQIVEENTCKICYIELSSLSSLKRHIVSAHMDHTVNQKAINCPECDNEVPEHRLAIHLKFCQRVDSRTGEALMDTIPSSSSGFFDFEDSTLPEDKSKILNRKDTPSPEVVYEESAASNNLQSSDELPDVEELPPLEICIRSN